MINKTSNYYPNNNNAYKQSKNQVIISNTSPALQIFVLTHPEYSLAINQNTAASGNKSEIITLRLPTGPRPKEELSELLGYLSAKDQSIVASVYSHQCQPEKPELKPTIKVITSHKNKSEKKPLARRPLGEIFIEPTPEEIRRIEILNAQAMINPKLPRIPKALAQKGVVALFDAPTGYKLNGEYLAYQDKVYSLLGISFKHGTTLRTRQLGLIQQTLDFLKGNTGIRRWYTLGLIETIPTEKDKIELLYYLCRLTIRAKQDVDYPQEGIDHDPLSETKYKHLISLLNNLPHPYNNYLGKIENIYGYSFDDWRKDPN